MQYRVQTSMQTDNRRIVQVHGWVDADTHFDAAVQWKAKTLAQPKVWVDPVLVVERATYVAGHYSHEGVDIGIDYAVGLRELSQD